MLQPKLYNNGFWLMVKTDGKLNRGKHVIVTPSARELEVVRHKHAIEIDGVFYLLPLAEAFAEFSNGKVGAYV